MTEPEKKRLYKINTSSVLILDEIFFVFAGIASIWLAVTVFWEGLYSGIWWFAGLFLTVWIILAYLGLPRLHSILTRIYVPDYFIGRTKNSDGLLGDPINLAFLGSEENLHKTMQEAGWVMADPVTPLSIFKIVRAVLMKKSYASAPVSPLYLFGRRHDFAYQQEVEGNPTRRHHVRFWKCPEGWMLPGGHKVDWLAAATYDKSVGLSLFTLQITHKIDSNIDIERDYVIESIKNSPSRIKVDNLKDFATGYHARNGGGDAVQTDGNLPVVKVKGVKSSASNFAKVNRLKLDDYDLKNVSIEDTVEKMWRHRPPQILTGSVLMILILIFSALQLIVGSIIKPDWLIDFLNNYNIHNGTLYFSFLPQAVFSIAVVAVELLLVLRLMYGDNLARIILLGVSAITVVIDGVTLSSYGRGDIPFLALFNIGMHILILILFSSESARLFTNSKRIS